MRTAATFFAACLLLANVGSAYAQVNGNGMTSGAGRAAPTGATTSLSLAQIASQQGVLVDAFKLPADADDTAAFNRAVTAQVPILCGPKTYHVNDFNTGVVSNFILRGVPGCVIQRTSSTTTWFGIKAATVYIENVTFDANKGSVSANNWAVLMNQGGQNITIKNSTFKNNSGSLGSCLAILSTGPSAGGKFVLDNVETTGCTFNPLYLASVSNGIVKVPYVHDNTGGGIQVGANGAASGTNYATNISITDGLFISNTGGSHVTVDGFAAPFTFGTPGATYVTASGNTFQDGDSTHYQLSVFGDHNSAVNNKFVQSSSLPAVFGAIDCNSRYSLIENNDITLSGSSYGVDCGGAIEPGIRNNHVTLLSSGTAVDPGGTQNGNVTGNKISVSGTGIGVLVYQLEGSNGTSFPTYTSGLGITDNDIIMSGSSATGVQVLDNAGGTSGASPIVIANNRFAVSGGGTGSFQDITYFANGSALVISGNTHNGSNIQFVDPSTNPGDIVVDNVFDHVSGSGSTNAVRAFINPYVSTYNAGGSVLYITTTAGGSNYTAATVLTVSGCTSATASPLINAGVILGAKVTNHGTGCSAPTVAASDTGGGSGATFTATTAPRLPGTRTLTYLSAAAVIMQQSGGAIGITNGFPLYLPTATTVRLITNSLGTLWNFDGDPPIPTIAVGSLPSCTSQLNGARAIITGSASNKWIGRCNGTNWLWPDGTTVS